MKTFIPKGSVWSLVACSAFALGLMPKGEAVEVLRWERLPLTVSLVVGEERVVFLDRNVRVGVPDAVDGRLRVQSAGGAIYLRANVPIDSVRLQLQDAETGALILVDVTAVPATPGAAPLEPIRIIDAARQAERDEGDRRACGKSAPCAADFMQAAPRTPVTVVLTRYAAQSLYAPLRTIEEVAGIVPVALPRKLTLETLLPGLAVRAKALAAWRLADHWVTAVRLTHTAQGWLTLDPRTLQGDFVAATFQHPTLGPAGESTDTTVVYIVTRGHGLAEALLPAISPIDASINVSQASLRDGGHDEE